MDASSKESNSSFWRWMVRMSWLCSALDVSAARELATSKALSALETLWCFGCLMVLREAWTAHENEMEK